LARWFWRCGGGHAPRKTHVVAALKNLDFILDVLEVLPVFHYDHLDGRQLAGLDDFGLRAGNTAPASSDCADNDSAPSGHATPTRARRHQEPLFAWCAASFDVAVSGLGGEWAWWRRGPRCSNGSGAAAVQEGAEHGLRRHRGAPHAPRQRPRTKRPGGVRAWPNAAPQRLGPGRHTREWPWCRREPAAPRLVAGALGLGLGCGGGRGGGRGRASWGGLGVGAGALSPQWRRTPRTTKAFCAGVPCEQNHSSRYQSASSARTVFLDRAGRCAAWGVCPPS